MPVRLALVTPWFHPNVGGMERRCLEVATRIAARGHQVTVHTTATKLLDRSALPEGREAMEGFEVVRYRPKVFQGAYRMFFEPSLDGAEVVESHGYPSLVTDWIARRHGARVPVTAVPHGLTLYPKAPLPLAMRQAYDVVRGLPTLRRVRAIQAMTEDEAEWCREMGVATPVHVLPSGVEDAAFGSYDPGPAKARWGLDRYVVSVGRISPDKNPRLLIAAFARVAPAFPGLKLCLVGPDQGETAPARALAAELGLADRVVFTGLVPMPEKHALVHGADLLALPSQHEAEGLVLIEAWAQGRPVVATRVGGVPYVVRDGETGLLHEPGDVEAIAAHLRTLLADADLRARMGKAGAAEAREKYRWEVIVPRLEQLYRDLAEGRTPPAAP